MGRIMDHIHRLIDKEDVKTIYLGEAAYDDFIEEFKEEHGLSDEDNVHNPIIGGLVPSIDPDLEPDGIDYD